MFIMQQLKFINILFLLTIFNVFASDFYISSKDMYNIGHNVIYQIIFPLRPILIEIISATKNDLAQVDEFIVRAKEEIALLPYSTEVKIKIEKAILETLEKSKKFKAIQINSYVTTSFDFMRVFYQTLRAKVDFIEPIQYL